MDGFLFVGGKKPSSAAFAYNMLIDDTSLLKGFALWATSRF